MLLIKILKKVRFFYWQIIGHAFLKHHGVEYGKNCTLYGLPIIKRHPQSSITIGDNVVLCSHSQYTDLGVNHPVILRTLQSGASISIGSNSGLSGTSICSAESVSIGEEVLVGANVSIFDTDFHPVSPKNRRFNTDPNNVSTRVVHISSNVFIGANSIITKGVSIGEGAVIGCGTVVVKNVLELTIIGENPNRVIGHV